MKRPNIIFVFADQLRYSAVGCCGNDTVRTPHFDRLATEGIALENAYSACPLCAPYRAQVLSGLYSHQNGVVCNEYRLRTDIPTLADCLSEAGYETGYIGKWHLGRGPYPVEKRYGFAEMTAYNICGDGYTGSYHRNEEGPFPFTKWLPEQETDFALDFIERRSNEEPPFFLMLSWIPPHWPYHTFPGAYNTYRPQDMRLPPNVPAAMYRFEQEETALYYGNVSALDAQMGRIQQKLDELGIAEDTILIFTSDHGDHLGAHGYGKPRDQWLHHTKRASKATPYEDSVHIPFLLRYPRAVAPETRNKAFFNSVDVMPTLLGMCGVPIPHGLAGHDLSFVFRGEEGTSPDSVYLQILGEGWPNRGPWVGFWRGVRTENYTYARWLGNEVGPLLFDRQDDPYELNNRYGKPGYEEIQRQLETRLQQWMRETADPFDYGERDPKSRMLLIGQEFADPEFWAHR